MRIWVGEALCLLPLHVGGAGRWSWGAPLCSTKGLNTGLAQPPLTLGRSTGGDSWGQLWRVTPPAPGNGGQAPHKASREEAGVEWEDGSQEGVLRPQAAADGGPQAQGIRVRQPGRGLRNDSRTRSCSLAGSAPWLQVTSLWWCAGQRAVGASPV